MSVLRFNERPGTRRITRNPPTFEVGYVCAGAFDSGSVSFLANSLTAPLVATDDGILYRQDIRVEEQGFELYHVTVPYAKDSKPTGSVRFAGSTTGGTLHITHSRETVESYPAGTATDHKRAIAVRRRGDELEIDGADVHIPALKISYTIRHPQGVINEAFARNVGRKTSIVNEDTWRGFAPGEVLFLGCDFSDGSDAEAEATYHFACEENLQGLVIDTITGIEKNGHDLLWVEWEDVEVGNKPTTKPIAVHIERLYRRVAFSSVFSF